MTRPAVFSWPAVIFLLVKAPRTVKALSSLTGAKERTISRYMHALKAEGLLSAGRASSKCTAQLWTWCGSPEGSTCERSSSGLPEAFPGTFEDREGRRGERNPRP